MSDQKHSDDEPEEGAAAREHDAKPTSDVKSNTTSVDDADDEDDEDDEDEPATAAKSARAAKTEPPKNRSAKPGAAASAIPSRTILVAVVALAAGAAAGWFGHDAQAKAKLRAESVPAAAGSGVPAGPCGSWEQKICASGGAQSAACQQAKAATDLLTPSACEVALEAVPATLAKVKAARAPCDKLTGKLCGEVAKGSGTCAMVTERMASFPGDRCQEMLDNYDQVAQQVRMIDQQSSRQMGADPHGAPPGAHPQGMPPGSMPRGAPGAPHP